MTEFLGLVNDAYIAYEVDFWGCSFAFICRNRTYVFVMHGNDCLFAVPFGTHGVLDDMVTLHCHSC